MQKIELRKIVRNFALVSGAAIGLVALTNESVNSVSASSVMSQGDNSRLELVQFNAPYGGRLAVTLTTGPHGESNYFTVVSYCPNPQPKPGEGVDGPAGLYAFGLGNGDNAGNLKGAVRELNRSRAQRVQVLADKTVAIPLKDTWDGVNADQALTVQTDRGNVIWNSADFNEKTPILNIPTTIAPSPACP